MARPTSGSSAARPTSSPASISAMTSPAPLGGYAQGGRISAPIWKQWALTALKDQPKVPFVAPPGIRWVRIDRATGKRVFGVFPTTDDPKAPVIWEAFQPQTEPRGRFTARRAIRTARKRSRGAEPASSKQHRRRSSSKPRSGIASSAAAAARSPARRRLANAERALVAGVSRRVAGRFHSQNALQVGPTRRELDEGEFTMRAEAQAHIDQINAATALLRRFLDWDRAQQAPRRAQREGRGFGALERSQGGAGGHARAPPARGGDRRDPRDRARARRHRPS